MVTLDPAAWSRQWLPVILRFQTGLHTRKACHVQDIIFFEHDGEIVSKRVIGVAGDAISFADGKVLVNGEALDESNYLDDTIITECEYTYDVPNGCVLFLEITARTQMIQDTGLTRMFQLAVLKQS